MDFRTYKTQLKQIEFGKKLPDALYLHEDALPYIPEALQSLLKHTIQERLLTEFEFNIVKWSLRDFKVSLLHYPLFFEDSYPALHQSCTLDLLLKKYRISSYQKSKNPPILHRKETFLPPEHPSIPFFKTLTLEGEQAGLYENTKIIGFKQSWERLIHKKGYELIEGHIKKRKTEPLPNTALNLSENVEIERHKTAINRYALSAPMQSLANHEYLNGDFSVFDYGCGKADDLRELQAHKIEASGWDPVYAPETPKKVTDIVNLGFVINVIEDAEERKDCLKQAFDLTKQFLVVSVMLGGEGITERFRPYKDGVITSRNTFQKYYSQQELRSFLEDSLGKTPIAVAPGIFYVFKEELEEQRFLSNRQRRKRDWNMLNPRQRQVIQKAERLSLYEKHREVLDDYWQLSLDLGRVPHTTEFEYSRKIRSVLGSMKKAFLFLCELHGSDFFQEARHNRIEDLSVYLSLSLFGRKKPYVHLPAGLKRDVKEFFGGYKEAKAAGNDLLFSVGKPQTIYEGCEYASKKMKIGFLDGNHSLQFHVSQLKELPPRLRVYVGCATQLYGDVENADLIKIHMHSGKLTLLKYDDFTQAIPELKQRIKIKLRTQEIDFFDYGTHFEPQPLYLKSRYLPEDFPDFQKQKDFDTNLESLGLFDFSGFGPSKEEFNRLLTSNSYKINRFVIKDG